MLLSATDLNSEQADLVDILGKGVKQISMLVSDILNFSALSSGQFPTDERRVRVREDLIESIWQMAREFGRRPLPSQAVPCTCLTAPSAAAGGGGTPFLTLPGVSFAVYLRIEHDLVVTGRALIKTSLAAQVELQKAGSPKKVEFVKEVDDAVPEFIVTDSSRVMQIVTNCVLADRLPSQKRQLCEAEKTTLAARSSRPKKVLRRR